LDQPSTLCHLGAPRNAADAELRHIEATMSDVPRGPGWWQASDLKWYPPERHPQYLTPRPPPPVPHADASLSAAPAGGRRVSEAERNQILDNALASRARGVISVSNGRFLGWSGPRIRRLSASSAEVMWGARATHPAKILLDLIFSFITCGIWLFVWFIATLRRPKIQTVTIDEYGNQLWRNVKISPLQRVLSIAVGIAILWWMSHVGQFVEAARFNGRYFG
jgi:hypothetical protein